MYQTPWTKKPSSVPSDRIRPPSSQPTAPKGPAKGKGKDPKNNSKEPAKSREIVRLESLAEALRNSSGTSNDPKGGCFCQAREHDISPYTPICRACGLILCKINQPQFSCPHCSISLLSAVLRDSLLARLKSQISDMLAKEAEAREKAAEEVRRAVGAFPTLAGSSPATGQLPGSPAVPAPRSVDQTHKVLSVNSKTKKVIVSSYTSTPLTSRPVSRADTQEAEEGPIRIPPPPGDVSYARKKLDPARPWANLNGDRVKYIPASRVDEEGIYRDAGRNKRRNKGKSKENESEKSIETNKG